ncbi:MAG TPA: hypothetical protein VJ733_00910 [Candidatus Binatia bacterium]|nr:hypothetical protein [Candidatus Binatia bacterium]
MSGMLYGVGVFAVVAGAIAVSFGLPVHEFSFGNTLIGAGTTAAVGGLIVIGLGAVVAQLQRIHEALATRAPIKSSRQFDTFENAAGARNAPAPGRIPFPPRPRADAGIREPQPFEPRVETAVAPVSHADEPQAATSFAPTLRNPEESPVTVEDDVSLLPPHPMAPGQRETTGPGPNEDQYEPKLDADWRLPPPPAAPAPTRPPQSSYFDAMWPAEPKLAKEPSKEPSKSPVGPETKHEAAAAPGWHADTDVPMQPPASEPRGVAILKSGVVDGMGYTLYVDGSIEAELPQGTLRFGSINELRSHLEKNT